MQSFIFITTKGTNGTTGLKNPTIVVGEFQYLKDTYKAIKVSDIASIAQIQEEQQTDQ